MVNVIDGGGWLARSQDLEKMKVHCDKVFSNADINGGKLQEYLQELSAEDESI